MLCAALFAIGAAAPAGAKTLRWSSAGDILTMDPHAQNEGLNNTFADYVYEPLVTRGRKLELEPALALSWREVNPTTWRFTLRPNVKFHDGSAFTADDVVFSIERALTPTSNFGAYMEGITGAKKVDALTVDILTRGPAPVLIDQLTEVRMMSKAWSVKNGVTRPQDFKAKEETFAVRNANGTGPYVLKSREADVKTVFTANPAWWGKRDGNVDEVVYAPIKSESTRVAALLSGEVDFVLDPPVQDIPRLKASGALKVVEGNENRTVFLGFDTFRDELQFSNVKGKNPFKDVRVRRAFYQAIDDEAIHTQVLRGLGVVTGSMVAPQVRGYTKEADTRLPLDRTAAKKLLADAGYPNGFEITLDCPNNRYIKDEGICQAVSAMLAQIGVTVRLNLMPRANYFPKVQNCDTSFYLLGWGVPTFDAQYTLHALVHTPPKCDGEGNYGRYSNKRIDAVIEKLATEGDLQKRVAITREALTLLNEDVGYIPLHHQVIPWAMKQNVTVVHRADNKLLAKWVRID